jgi:hypothetical protein
LAIISQKSHGRSVGIVLSRTQDHGVFFVAHNRHEKERNKTTLVAKPNGKKCLWRYRKRWNYGNEMGQKEKGCENVNQIQLVEKKKGTKLNLVHSGMVFDSIKSG